MPHTLSRLSAEAFNPGMAAQMYGQLAAVLAGFAFAGLMFYLSRPDVDKGTRVDSPDSTAAGGHHESPGRRPYSSITPDTIVPTLFYAMSALTICAFLYGRLASESTASGKIYLELALYGVVLGPSVLSLFYAMNLVMLTHKVTTRAAESTRWVVVAVGPAVIMSFLSSILASAWQRGCQNQCSAWTSPKLLGILATMGFVVLGLLLTTVRGRRFAPVGAIAHLLVRLKLNGPIKKLLGTRWTAQITALKGYRPIRELLNAEWVRNRVSVFQRRPFLPVLITLCLAAAIGIASLWIQTVADSFNPSSWVAHVVFVLAVIVMALFAITAGSVLDDRSTNEDAAATTAPSPDAGPPTGPRDPQDPPKDAAADR